MVIFSLHPQKKRNDEKRRAKFFLNICLLPRKGSNGENTSIGGEQQEKESICGFDRTNT
jgi:hypothetical protein